jgi:signal transduction histidine kinase
LSLVREIAQLHGGDASLVNRPEGGARAAIRLPKDLED